MERTVSIRERTVSRRNGALIERVITGELDVEVKHILGLLSA